MRTGGDGLIGSYRRNLVALGLRAMRIELVVLQVIGCPVRPLPNPFRTRHP